MSADEVVEPDDAQQQAEETEADSIEAEVAEAKAARGGGDKVGDRFKIEFERPLAQFNTSSASAYAAVDEKSRQRMLAMICKPRVPFRTRPLRALQGRPVTNVVPIRDSGVVSNPFTNERALAIIMDMPEGGVFVASDDELKGVATEKEVTDVVLPQILTAVENLLNRGVVHRNIRPSNLWYLDRERQQLFLGDCVTAPPGFNQPIVYEPIDRMMATKAGRGFGAHLDDTYAMGVTLVGLLLGKNPTLGRSNDALIAHKIMLGTFTALTGDERFPQPTTALLRGMLADNPDERWSAELVRAWREGRSIKTRRSLPDKKATAPINFLNKEFFYQRQLAYAMALRPDDGSMFARSGKIEPWLRRNLEASKVSEEIAYLASGSEGSRSGTDQLMLTQVLYTLDPWGPLRYRELSFCFDGIGPVIADAYVEKNYEKLHAMRTLISRGIIEKWINMKSHLLNLSLNSEVFMRMATVLQDNELGKGMERLLYDLNPSTPCLSDLVWDHNCLNIRGLLLTMNEITIQNIDAPLVDKHTVAFICSRSRKVEEQYRGWTRSKELGAIARDMGILALFANAQRDSHAPPLKALTRWCVRRMEPVIESYHSRDRREKLMKRLDGVVKKGDLMALLDLLGNPKTRDKDVAEYHEAIVKYSEMETEVHNLEMDDMTRRRLAVRVGHRIANSLAYVILGVTAAYTVLIFL